jgi:hypothetical protein
LDSDPIKNSQNFKLKTIKNELIISDDEDQFAKDLELMGGFE